MITDGMVEAALSAYHLSDAEDTREIMRDALEAADRAAWQPIGTAPQCTDYDVTVACEEWTVTGKLSRINGERVVFAGEFPVEIGSEAMWRRTPCFPNGVTPPAR